MYKKNVTQINQTKDNYKKDLGENRNFVRCTEYPGIISLPWLTQMGKVKSTIIRWFSSQPSRNRAETAFRNSEWQKLTTEYQQSGNLWSHCISYCGIKRQLPWPLKTDSTQLQDCNAFCTWKLQSTLINDHVSCSWLGNGRENTLWIIRSGYIHHPSGCPPSKTRLWVTKFKQLVSLNFWEWENNGGGIGLWVWR